jgi:thiamine pyrophosphate-dependent acetolactate synthase large subunit-like protein
VVTRYECLEVLAPAIGDALTVLSIGGIENEWFHLRPGPGTMRLMMGAVVPVGVGLATALPTRRVIALDTDGSLLLNLGALCTVGALRPPNLTIIVMDNECYESIGGIPSHTARGTDLAGIARAAGIEHASTTRTLGEFRTAAAAAMRRQDATFIAAKVAPGAKDLPALSMDGLEMKYRFLRYIEETAGIRVLGGAPQRMPAHMLSR